MLRRIFATDLTVDIGEVTHDIAENPGIIRKYLEGIVPGALGFLTQLLVAILILLVGLKLIKVLVKVVRRSLERAKVEMGVISFLCSLLRYGLYVVLVLMILGQFGVSTGSVVAVLGSAGLAVGLALQGSLANFAGGVLILLLKPFVIQDYIVDNGSGKEGTVTEISIFYTKLLTPDNKVVLIPNGSLSNSTITNVTREGTRRLDLSVGVSYDSNLAKVKAVLEEIAENEMTRLEGKPINVFVDSLGESSIEMGLRIWVKTGDYFDAKWRMTETIKNTFDEQGITIPFPQLDVQIKQSGK